MIRRIALALGVLIALTASAAAQVCSTAAPGDTSARCASDAFVAAAVAAASVPAGVDQNILNSQASSYAVASTDCGKRIYVGSGGSGTVTLPAVAGFAGTCRVSILNANAGRGQILSGFPTGAPSILWPLQEIDVAIENGVWAVISQVTRWRPTAPVSFFVDPVAGADPPANDGLAAGSGNAFRHWSACYANIAANLDISLANATFTATLVGSLLTVSSIDSPTLAVGQLLNGLSTVIPPATTISSLGTGTGGVGTYNVSNGLSFTGTGSGINLTTTSVTGTIVIGQNITGTGVPAGTTILGQTSGTPGGAGIYTTSQATTSSGATITSSSSGLMSSVAVICQSVASASYTNDGVGAYAGAVGQKHACDIVMDGNGSTLARSDGQPIWSTGSILNEIAVQPKFCIRRQTLTTTAPSLYGLQCNGGVIGVLDGINFGSMPGGIHMFSEGASYCQALNQVITISGGAAYHDVAWVTGGDIIDQSNIINLVGTPAFTGAYVQVQWGATAFLGFDSFIGSATGPRYVIQNSGILDTQNTSQTYLPGNSVGTCTNGLYAGNLCALNSSLNDAGMLAMSTPAGTIGHIVGAANAGPLSGMDTISINGSYWFRRANGSGSVPTALLSGQAIGGLQFYGYDANIAAPLGYTTSTNAFFGCSAGENWSATNHGTFCSEYTTGLGGGALAENRRTQPSGGQSFGNNNVGTDIGNGNVLQNGYAVAGAAPGPPQGRLTLTSLTPVLTSTVSGSAAVLYTPYQGNLVPITNDGTTFIMTACSQLQNINANSATGNAGPTAVANNSVYDYFVWNSGTLSAPTCTLTRGPLWTNDTTRSAGTALTRVNGILLNSVTITNGPAASRGTYVGTCRSNGTATFDYIFGASASGGTAGFFGCWNAYNRVSSGSTVIDSGTLYSYTSATIRQARASAGNQITFVVGLQEDAVQVSYMTRMNPIAAIGSFTEAGVGFDTTTAFSLPFAINISQAAQTDTGAATISGIWSTPIGVHVLSANEASDGTNANSFNTSTNASLMITVRN